MKKLLIYILCIALTAVTAIADNDGGTQSPFSLGVGADALAQGGANIASGDAATAPFWNASRLAQAEQMSLAGFHCRLYDSDVAYQYFGAVFPTLDWGTVGIGVFRLGIDGIEQRDDNNVLIPGDLSDNRLALYLAYAKNISGYDVGMAVAFEHHSLGDYSATSSPGLNISVGRTFNFRNEHIRRLSLALVGRNLIKPGMELVDERVDQPSAFDGALALTVKPMVRWDHDLKLTAAINNVDYLDARFRAGLEYSFHDMVSLRGGVRNGKLSAGAGLTYKSLTFDYALIDRDLGSLHMFTISTSFGAPLSTRRKMRTEKREAEFNNLMNDRLVSRNRDMIDNMVRQGSDFLDNGNLVEAGNYLDRAMFLARNADIDTSGIYTLAEEARRRLKEVTDKQIYGQYMDSAQVKFEAGDYLPARYFAGLALEKIPNSAEAANLIDRANDAVKRSTTREEMLTKQLFTVDSLLSYGRTDRALKIARAVSEYAPDDERVKLTLKKAEFEYYKETATKSFDSGDLKAAGDAVDRALVLYPAHQWCLNMKERIKQEGKRLAALYIKPRIENKPVAINDELLKEVKESYETARSLFEKGSLPEAIGHWEKVERLAPDYLSVRQYLVRAYKFVGIELYGQNSLQEAIDVWKKAAFLSPGNEEIKDYIKRTENEIRKLEELSYETR